ncbi:MAG: DoxX family membrane protein [Actinomycetota bacterium]
MSTAAPASRRTHRTVTSCVAIGVALVAVLLLTIASPAAAHVKWFSDFDFRQPPKSFREIITVGSVTALALATVAIGVLPAIDRWLERQPIYAHLTGWLTARRPVADPILRYLVAAALILAWGDNALLAPELDEPASWVGWFQLVLAVVLAVGRTNRLAGIGLLLLWFIGVFEYGAMHMIDYLAFVGISAYFVLRSEKEQAVRDLALPALYLTVGFSLMWLGFEKLVYPDWSLALLDIRPELRLGIPADEFVLLAAFVEISLGFLLIIGLLGRPLALVITLVFITTTLVFGRVEVIGHTPLHAALIVFLLQGAGRTYPAPIAIHERLPLRMAFAAVNMVLLTAVVGVAYTAAAEQQFNDAVAEQGPAPEPVIVDNQVPALVSATLVETAAGTAVTLDLEHWTFVPPSTPDAPRVDEGVGYGILRADNQIIAQVTGDASALWTDPPSGSLTLTLYTVGGQPIHTADGQLRITVDL